jgi:divalent metal cation (Fe/Co/Zn/Cd) transporter
VPGVLEVDRARIRRSGNGYFADLSVALSRNVTFQKSEQVVGEVTAAARRILPDADVVVHSLPREVRGENIFDRIRAVAARHNLGVHDISIQDLHGRLHVEQHLEMQETLPLKQAHDRVTQLENEMREQIGEISTILTHIESEPATIETGDELIQNAALERQLKEIAPQFQEVKDVHEMHFKRVGGKLYVSCHCTMADELPLSRVHEVMTALEIRFKQEAPGLFRVLIHPEPQTDNRR